MKFNLDDICEVCKQLALYDYKLDDLNNIDIVYCKSGDILVCGENNGHKDIMYMLSFTKDFILEVIRKYEEEN